MNIYLPESSATAHGLRMENKAVAVNSKAAKERYLRYVWKGMVSSLLLGVNTRFEGNE
jgi:hypothetical protein